MPDIITSTNGAVRTITLNRPDKFNSITEPMALELQKELRAANSDDIRCVILNSAGKAFCAGQDLPEVVEREKDPNYELADTVRTTYNPIITAIREMEKPVVCSVQGTAAGAGANIAFACDIVIASKEAVFVQAFSKIGLIPDSGGTWFLPRIIGLMRTNALYMLDEKLSAEKALEYGLITRVVGADGLDEAISETAAKLATLPTRGFSLYKQAVNKSFDHSLKEHLSMEADLQSRAGHTDDYKEGVAAFLEKRKPKYKGS